MALTAAIAGHGEHAPVALQVRRLDPAEPLQCRCRHHQDLAVQEGCSTLDRQCYRIALSVSVARIAVDLVEEQVANRHRAQTDRRVGAGQDQHPTRKLLHQHRVAAVARARIADPGG
ncbi:hypothetical protein BAL199_14982 [alpha proteobacterium BAL199]|nr:hypothetical protein BAL199_14982 [alpha proteobacterium BAL199]